LIQELVNDYSGLNSANIAFFLKDNGSTSGWWWDVWNSYGKSN
jgi:hypothetical protein